MRRSPRAAAPEPRAYRDAFGLFRVSQALTILDAKQLYDSRPLVFDDAQTSGSGTSSTHNPLRGSTTMAVSNLTAGTRVRQSKRWPNYQAGKGQLLKMTSIFGAPTTGIRRRQGLFETSNGIFFDQTSAGMRVVIRSNVTGSPVERVVAQTDFSLDKLDGKGPSRLTFDASKAQIGVIAFQYLGVGDVWVGFDIEGQTVLCHQFKNSNVLDSVYMSSPNLPVRYEISNDGTGPAATFETVCCQVASEGGRDSGGLDRAISRRLTPYTITVVGAYHPILAMRLKSTCLGAYVAPKSLSIICTSTSAFNWVLLLNPTFSETPTWAAHANSCIEKDVTSASTVTVTGGTELAEGYAQSQNEGAVVEKLRPDLALGSKIDGTADIVCLALAPISQQATETFYASLGYVEDV